ncbi:hypothetical protein BD626DRAFT_408405 [Schizophyllum amplum]|uniref:Protein kinase domain-containing protein n=1 Tax=Schizophyllum amplum TaxID=97359 RepID=A0A550C531_9AGAR|nr:hypothetical protein BD626DRAFT_408405 [Auriculariopsis ampla]
MPAHLAEHWSGYNIRRPFRAPTPLGAVVPRSFGYYVPTDAHDHDGYLSGILLVEDCGEQIKEEALNEDEQQECADMFLRFHQAGWVHKSAYPRNVVVQKGPLTAPPAERTMADPSFRVIDFGRSKEDKSSRAEDRWRESQDVLSLFGCGQYKKQVKRGDLFPGQ